MVDQVPDQPMTPATRAKVAGAIGMLVLAAAVLSWNYWPAPVATGGQPPGGAAAPPVSAGNSGKPVESGATPAAADKTTGKDKDKGAAGPEAPQRGNFRVGEPGGQPGGGQPSGK